MSPILSFHTHMLSWLSLQKEVSPWQWISSTPHYGWRQWNVRVMNDEIFVSVEGHVGLSALWNKFWQRLNQCAYNNMTPSEFKLNNEKLLCHFRLLSLFSLCIFSPLRRHSSESIFEHVPYTHVESLVSYCWLVCMSKNFHSVENCHSS
jgi:hypothetical protein